MALLESGMTDVFDLNTTPSCDSLELKRVVDVSRPVRQIDNKISLDDEGEGKIVSCVERLLSQYKGCEAWINMKNLNMNSKQGLLYYSLPEHFGDSNVRFEVEGEVGKGIPYAVVSKPREYQNA
jgi:hypothetical protein